SIWYTAVSGIGQTVWLEPVPEKSISELSMIPDLDGRKLRLTVHSGSSGEFNAIARLGGKTVGRVSGKLNQECAVPLSDVRPWSPDAPTLYDLDISHRGGDRVTSYFG